MKILDNSVDSNLSTQKTNKIGGWLYLIAIGIIFSPISNAIHFKQLVEIALNANWEFIWQKGPMAILTIVFQFSMQGYMLIFSVILVVLFFYKSYKFPKMFIIYISSIFILGLISIYFTASVPNIEKKLIAEAIAFPISIFIMALIWVPYLLKSKRVKRTFITGKNLTNKST